MHQLVKINKSLEEKIFLFICAAIALTITFNTAINSILSLATLVYWVVFTQKTFNINKIYILLFFILSSYFTMSLIGLLNTNNYSEAFFRIQQRTALMFFPLVFIFSKIDYYKLFNNSLKYFRIGIIITSIYCLIYSLIKYMDTNNYESFFGANLCHNLQIYPYLLALCCLLSILTITNNLQKNVKVKYNNATFLNLLQLILFSIIILLIGNRQVLLLFFICVSFLIFKLSHNIKQTILFYVMFILFGIIFFLINPNLNKKIQEVINTNKNSIPLDTNASLGKSWNGVSIRNAIWKCSLKPIKENILFGAGTGDVQDILQEAYEERMFYFASRYNKYNAHNQYIQTIIGQGVLGLLLLILTFLYPLYKLKFNYNYFFFIMCFIIIFLTESVLETNKGIIIFAFTNTIFVLAIFGNFLPKNK